MAPVKLVTKYSVGQDVLARWNDGLFYLGTILRVEDRYQRCYIQFEDHSEHWTMYKDIQKGPNQGEIICSVCQGEKSELPNEIVLCDQCGLGYHQKCHNPAITSDILKPDVSWKCRLCVFASTTKRGGATKRGPNAQALQVMKQSLPYDLSKLTWDAHHKTNDQQIYCYCGGPGDWYRKMLQCTRCRQWFHEACLQCLDKPLVFGDRFYVFICSFCNSGPEFLTRLRLKWHDIGQLALFNMTVMTRKKYHLFDEELMSWVNRNWDDLQTGKLTNSTRLEREQNIREALASHTNRFQNGREIKKKVTLWALRLRVPPPAPQIVLPPEGTITDEVFHSVYANSFKKKLRGSNSGSPLSLKHKRRASSEPPDEVILRKPKKPRKHLQRMEMNGTLPSNQGFPGYTGNSGRNYSLHNGTSSSHGSSDTGRDMETSRMRQTLDSIIPWQSSYEGLNHPFKTVLEKNEEIEHKKIKAKLLNSYQQNGCSASSEESDSQTETTESDSQSLSTVGEEPPQPAPIYINGRDKNGKKKRGRKSKAELAAIAEAQAQAKALEKVRRDKLRKEAAQHKPPAKTPHHAKNVVDKSTLDGMRSKEVPINQLRSSVSTYFGAADRLKNGERFQVLARRVSPDGRVQYLIQWEGVLG